jgi:hypothetical protein
MSQTFTSRLTVSNASAPAFEPTLWNVMGMRLLVLRFDRYRTSPIGTVHWDGF